MSDITQTRLKELLHYCPMTGIFRWLVSPTGTVPVGSMAGTSDGNGYLQITVDKQRIRAHRLAWLYVHGYLPKSQIDHRNGVRDANWIENLREADNAQNHQNRKPNRNNSSGHPGIYWHKGNSRWCAQITRQRKKINVGYFTNLEDAVAHREAAKALLHAFQPVARMKGETK